MLMPASSVPIHRRCRASSCSDTTRRLGRPIETSLVRAYLALPRAASYLARKWIERVERHEIAQLGIDLKAVTGLPPAGSDEELVRDLIARRLDEAEGYAQWLDRQL